jgi:hypothetical protein
MDEHRLHDAVLLVALHIEHKCETIVLCKSFDVVQSKRICVFSGKIIKDGVHKCCYCEKRISVCDGCYSDNVQCTCDDCLDDVFACNECVKQHESYVLFTCTDCAQSLCKDCTFEEHCEYCDTMIYVCNLCRQEVVVCDKCDSSDSSDSSDSNE